MSPPSSLLGGHKHPEKSVRPLPPQCLVLGQEGRGAAVPVPHLRRGRGALESPHKVWSLGSAELARFGVEWGEVRRKRCERDMAPDAPAGF